MSLEDIRNRNKGGKLDKFLKAASKTSMGRAVSNDNEREETYYPERDKSGNGSAIIRFLPGLQAEDEPYYVERFQHGFEHNNKWYIEFCPTTLGDKCPVCEFNQEMRISYGQWDDCPVDVQDLIKKRGRNRGFRAGYYANIMVIKDPATPENEGKVFLFNFGKAIMDFIMAKVHPEGDGLGEIPDPVDVFDLVVGANFKFIIRKKDKRADYSTSSFEVPAPCPEFNDADQFELHPLVTESVFKSYEDLSKRFNFVLGEKSVSKTAEDAMTPEKESKSETPPSQRQSPPKEDTPPIESYSEGEGEGDSNENMSYFKEIADEIKI